jgi:hypothetical protein
VAKMQLSSYLVKRETSGFVEGIKMESTSSYGESSQESGRLRSTSSTRTGVISTQWKRFREHGTHGNYLAATEFLDSASPEIRRFAENAVQKAADPRERAIALFYAVRDGIRYEIYGADLSRCGLRASSVLNARTGFCVHKAILFAAALRAARVPARLCFADVRNHLCTDRLRSILGGDVFYFHAYAETFLESRWVKATPVFNAHLCRLFGMTPLEFDGVHDATLHPYDQQNRVYMEFLRDHGAFADFPHDFVVGGLRERYLGLFSNDERTIEGGLREERIAETPPA